MSLKKTLDEAYSCGENIFIKNQNKNLDENCLKKSDIHRGKRKRTIKIKNSISCVNCKKEKGIKDITKFKNKNDLIKQIQSLLQKIDDNKNIPQLITKIKWKINRNKYICKECFKEIIKSEDFCDIIKNLLFIKKRKKLNSKKSIYINNTLDLEVKKDKNDINNNKENNDTIINIKNSFIKETDEFEECFKTIVQCLKLAVFEVSCFVQSFKIYTNNNLYVNNLVQNEYNIKFFFHCFIQTRIRLDNLYMLINNIVIKYQNITKRMISNLSSINLKNNEDLKNNYDLFIYNTNLILANISCFIKNFNICLNFLRNSK